MFKVKAVTVEKAIYNVYDVRYENNQTLFLVYDPVFGCWKWENAGKFKPIGLV